VRISRIHTDHALAEGDTVTLGDAQSHYLKNVLRLKAGAAVRLFNGRDAIDHLAQLEFDGKKALATVRSAVPAVAESPLHSQVVQALARPDHVDWMLQKTTELGVHRVLLFNAARTQTPLKAARLDKKLDHWRGIVVSACEQCGRARLPAVDFMPDLRAALAATIPGHRILLDSAGSPLPSLLQTPASGIAILLGPEGGLDAAEIQSAREAGFASASLGPRVLRTETAAAAALAIAQSCIGDMV
jgi:16S rRNA (uracil1498-N3)-methyltransferase